MPACQISEDLYNYAESIVTDIFESPIDQIETDDAADRSDFINKATKYKSTFTNADKTQQLMKSLIAERYKLYPDHQFLYDVPRLRESCQIQIFSHLGSHIIISHTVILGTVHLKINLTTGWLYLM